MPNNDLTHRDWLIKTTIKAVQAVDPYITYEIINFPDGTMNLLLSGISEESLAKIYFIVNTDYNNNYLYLENFFVYLNNNYSNPINVSGLTKLMIAVWDNSDTIGFLNGQNTQTPFNNPFISPINGNPISVGEFLDIYSTIVPFIPNTFGFIKHYSILLNPDLAEGAVAVTVVPVPIGKEQFGPPRLLAGITQDV